MALGITAAATLGLGKLTGALKGLMAAKEVTGAATAGKTLLGGLGRKAGDAMVAYLGPGGATLGNLGRTYGIDAGFGLMAGIQEPGDIGDKLSRGLTTAVSGAAGGMAGVGAFRGVTGKMPNEGWRQGIEFIGGMAGDQVGYSLGDQLQRMKNGGMTAWEKESLRQEMEALQQSGTMVRTDPFLYENGIG